jgi:hypothetical protein
MARNLQSKGSGHNSTLSFVDYRNRVAELMRQQKDLGDDIKELCAQCDEAGFASKSELRTMARESLKDQDVLKAKLDRMAELRAQLGALADTPLGEVTLQREEHSRRRRRNKSENALFEPDEPRPLKFSTEPPDAGQAGRNTAAAGLPESHNPFDLGTTESALWIAGYRNAKDQRELAKGAADSPYEDSPDAA